MVWRLYPNQQNIPHRTGSIPEKNHIPEWHTIFKGQVYPEQMDGEIFTLKQTNMGNLLYFIAVILVIGWAVGAFYFSLGGLIHALLVIAIIAVLFRLIGGRSV
jgi:hypothetical protein